MSEKFLNKYRIPSARLQTWDYGNEGAYYITICTNGRKQYFGEITHGVMILNGTGKLAERFWKEIPDHFPFIELDNFVIMPNHVHGILIINQEVAHRYDNITGNRNNTGTANGDGETMGTAETRLIASLRGGFAGNKNSMFHIKISRIIRWHKGRCSFEINKTHPVFAWQPRFYDHIIRDSADRERIRSYITDNPASWKDGKSIEK